jgi:Cysteine-rich CWC
MTLVRRALGSVSLRWLVHRSVGRGGKEPSTCEGCGGEFRCGATLAGCWCTQVRLTADARANLRARYKTCVCRACLEREAAK